MKTTALIMAGGKGERFWPRSRVSLPKQFLSFTDDGKTMLQLTAERISSLVDIKDIYIATNNNYKALVQQQLPGLPKENILCEPEGRNTAPCIGLGAVHIMKGCELQGEDDAAMIVLASDHLIKNTELFVETLKECIDITGSGDNLVTLGITPNYPETGYGYIRYNRDVKLKGGYKVDAFVEKPDQNTAGRYLREGGYLWNSGMFIWRVTTILDCFKRYMPSTFEGLMRIKDAVGTASENEVLEKEFPNLESQSVDYGIMEKAENIYTIPGMFGWDDVGSWTAVGRIRDNDEAGNVINGNVVAVDVKDCVIEGSNKLIAAVGLHDMVIVDTDDAILISTKEDTGKIKQVLANLRSSNRTQYL